MTFKKRLTIFTELVYYLCDNMRIFITHLRNIIRSYLYRVTKRKDKDPHEIHWGIGGK
jgi:hypothetical protein